MIIMTAVGRFCDQSLAFWGPILGAIRCWRPPTWAQVLGVARQAASRISVEEYNIAGGLGVVGLIGGCRTAPKPKPLKGQAGLGLFGVLD